jgi:hypothetical protein
MHKSVEQDRNKFKSDMRVLDNLANAYTNCESGDMRAVWKNKWYEMCLEIANRINKCD